MIIQTCSFAAPELSVLENARFQTAFLVRISHASSRSLTFVMSDNDSRVLSECFLTICWASALHAPGSCQCEPCALKLIISLAHKLKHAET